jgi:hypothetical protein
MSDVKDGPVPVLNFGFAREQTMDDDEFLDELLEEMLKDEAPKTLELLDAQDRGDNSEMRDVGTYITGCAANLGIEGLSRATRTFRGICKEIRDGDKSKEKLEERSQSVQTVFHELWRFRRFMGRRSECSDS